MTQETVNENDNVGMTPILESFIDILKSKNEKKIKRLINEIEYKVKTEGKNLTYNQLRNIFQILKDDKFENDISLFYLVLPKLAYIQARQKATAANFVGFLREQANKVETSEDYKAFVEFMNTIVAFHKLYA